MELQYTLFFIEGISMFRINYLIMAEQYVYVYEKAMKKLLENRIITYMSITYIFSM